MGLAGLGAGAGIRGVMGIGDFFGKKPSVDLGSSVPTSVPVLVPDDEDEMPLRKAGSLLKEAVRPGINWWQIPVGVGLGAGGVYGGWKLVDSLINRFKKRNQTNDLNDAKKEYETALQDAMLYNKRAASTTYDGLDVVFDGCCAMNAECVHGKTKEAFFGDAAHIGGGALATLMALTALGTGAGTYSWMRNKSDDRVLEDAIKKRRRMRTQPQPIYAYPVHRPLKLNAPIKDKDE